MTRANGKNGSPGTSGGLTIAEAAAAIGITAHTLRYYERIGLLAPIDRASSGHRRYGDDDLRWLQFLQRLRLTGMPIRKMLAYAKHVLDGDRGRDERRAILEEHRQEIEAQLAQLKTTLTIIEKKIALYDCGVPTTPPQRAASRTTTLRTPAASARASGRRARADR